MGMVGQERKRRPSDGEWLPWWFLSQAGWSDKDIAEHRGMEVPSVRNRLKAFPNLPVARLFAEEVNKLCQGVQGLILLGRMDEVDEAFAKLEWLDKVRRKQEALVDSNEIKALPAPSGDVQEGESAAEEEARLRAEIRDRIERQAVRFGFVDELRALQSGTAERGQG